MQRTVLVTGANSGIGLATALELARRDYHVIGSVRSDEKAMEVHRAASEAGVSVGTVLLDINDEARCREVIAGLSDLYALVNNAGYAQTGAVEDVTDEEAREQTETMVLAPMRLARLVLPQMKERGEGRIVNVSSLLGRITQPLLGWYVGTKHALEALSDALRVEVASAGVQVVLVEPGAVRSAVWDDARERLDGRDTDYEESYGVWQRLTKAAQPLMARPETVAETIGDALDARTPKARYLVGLDAKVLTGLDTVTPRPVRDALMRMGLRL